MGNGSFPSANPAQRVARAACLITTASLGAQVVVKNTKTPQPPAEQDDKPIHYFSIQNYSRFKAAIVKSMTICKLFAFTNNEFQFSPMLKKRTVCAQAIERVAILAWPRRARSFLPDNSRCMVLTADNVIHAARDRTPPTI